MKLIKSEAELIKQKPGLEGIYRHIELTGRTCYKSQDKMTKTSAASFVEGLIKRGHTAMLEHGTVYLKANNTEVSSDWINKYANNPYSKVKAHAADGGNFWCITTNYRVIQENNWQDDLQYLVNPTRYHEKRYTFKLTTDRGVSHKRFVA